LIDGGVPLREIWEILVALNDQVDDDDDHEFYAEEAGVILLGWLEDRDSIPATEVRAIKVDIYI
jgi:nuclear pore complex protein Nup155